MSFVSSTQGIRDEIAARLNEAETDNTSQYNNWINLGLRDIQTSFPTAPFLQTSADRTLSSGTRVYTNLPSDFDKMNKITYPVGDVALTYLSPEELDILQPSATEGGTPLVYTIRGQGSNGRIEYYPVPGGSYTVHYDYQKLVTTVSAGSAVPDVPEKYYDLLVLYGEIRGWRRRGRFSEASTIFQEYERLKERMKQELMRQATENSRVKSVREFGRQDYNDPIKTIFSQI